MAGSVTRALAVVLLSIAASSCSNPFGRQYEYEEQLYLSVDGSATVVLDASIAALVALRGVPLDPSPATPVDRAQVAALFAAPGCDEISVGQPWVRNGRRYVQVRVSVANIQTLPNCGPLAWSSYTFTRDDGTSTIEYVQEVGPPTGADASAFGFTGNELVGFKVHAPSRIYFHNVKRLEDGSNGEAGRGNVLTWEQTLADRLQGRPLRLEVRMGASSILFRTLWLFAGAFAAALLVLASAIWWTMKQAKKRQLIHQRL
jgi:hypothetical protein